MTKRSTVLGWQSPWSGDEADPIPSRYWVWYRVYRWTRQAKHRVGWHDWDPILIGGERCHWCGAMRGLPPKAQS